MERGADPRGEEDRVNRRGAVWERVELCEQRP